ncbi:MAG TPA: ADP-ribosylglycohydrolase family protein [Paludibaculum sp.]
MVSRIARFRGALLGLAVCDALGAAVEFQPPGSFPPVTEMTGGGAFHLEPGQWTDDTSMALCLAESLIERRAFDARDQMERYLRWWRHGHWSSTGHCFDIGTTTAAALRRFEETGDPFSGSTDPRAAGNGSLMRLGPVALWLARDEVQAVHEAARSSRTTHGAPACVDACRYFAALLCGALRGCPKEELLAPRFWRHQPLVSRIEEIRQGSFLHKEPPVIRGAGYVVESLEAVLWAFAKSTDFEHGALLAVNLGDDADTTGAIYGQIAGAFYGEDSIPERWRELLHRGDEIGRMAERLEASKTPGTTAPPAS